MRLKQQFFFLYTCLIWGFSSGQEWVIYNTSNSPIPSNFIRTVCIDSNGVKWFGSDLGLISMNDTVWTIYNITDRIADNKINDLRAVKNLNNDPEIWIATAAGISQILLSGMDSLSIIDPIRKSNSGLISDTVNALALDHHLIKWFGTNSGLSVLIDLLWESYSKLDMLTNNHILTIETKEDGWNYLGTKGGGVNRLRYDVVDGISGASAITTQWSQILSDTVLAILIDRQNIEWYGTKHGVSKHEGIDTKTNWTTYTIEDGLINNQVISIAEDAEGGIWFGTNAGLSRFFNNQWQSWSQETGLPADTIYDITCDSDGTLWLATSGGIAHLKSLNVALPKGDSYSAPANLNLRIFPTPFNQNTHITFTIANREKVTLRIYNILGKEIGDIFEGILSAGHHDLFWSGVDRHGNSLSSGIYILKAQIGIVQESRKLVLLR